MCLLNADKRARVSIQLTSEGAVFIWNASSTNLYLESRRSHKNLKLTNKDRDNEGKDFNL